jgi:hypothetical protein
MILRISLIELIAPGEDLEILSGGVVPVPMLQSSTAKTSKNWAAIGWPLEAPPRWTMPPLLGSAVA